MTPPAERTRRPAELRPGDQVFLNDAWRPVLEVGEPKVRLHFRISAGDHAPRAVRSVALDEKLRTRRPEGAD